MAIVTVKPIYPANGHLTRQAIEQYNPATDRFEPYTGGNLRVSFARNADGTNPVTGLQNLELTNVSGQVGSYYRIVNASELSPLVALANTVVFQIVTGGPYSALRVVTPMRVTVPRYAQ
jgi:hypothetical protein